MMTSEVATVYETILSIPGMNETVKIDLKVSRKNALLLSMVIENGIASVQNDKQGVLSAASKDSLQDIALVGEACLEKAGLKELSEKLKALSLKQAK